MPRNYILFCLILLLLPAFASAISVNASVNKYTISMAERLEYSIQVSGEGRFAMSEPAPPQIPNFSFYNMSSSRSSSTSIAGFSKSSKVTRTFTYYYIPKALGKSKIAQQKIKVDNKVYTTSEFNIEVVKAVGNSPSQSAPAIDPFNSYDPDLPWAASRIQGSTQLLAIPERSRIYKGQPVIVSYYLYTDQMVRSYNLDDEKDFPGYGKSTYFQPGMLEYEAVTYNGKRFQRALIKSLVLLPNETGKLQVPELRGTARIYEFGYLSRSLISKPEYLDVQHLPESGVPPSYGGAVGDFKVSESISSEEINLGEAITFSLRIAGKGNFNQFANPQFDSGAAQISNPVAVDRLNAGIDGSRTLYYTIIPSEKGPFTLPLLKFSWFDPSLGRYQSYQSPSYNINVKSANVISYFSGLWDGAAPKTMNPMLSRPEYPGFQNYLKSPWYWLSVFFILLATVGSAYVALNEKRRREDPEQFASRQAGSKLKRFLKESAEAAKQGSGEFYAVAERGLLDYLNDKYGLSRGLSTPEKIQGLQELGMSENLVQQFADFLERCMQARFAPQEIDALSLSEDLLLLNQLVSSFTRINQKGARK